MLVGVCFLLYCFVMGVSGDGSGLYLTHDRISDLVDDVRSGFERQERANDRIEANFDKMVTYSEFAATVQRLEVRDASIEDKLDSGLLDLRSQMFAGLARVSDEVSVGFERNERFNAARSVKNRWLVSSLIAGVGVLNAFLFGFFDRFFG